MARSKSDRNRRASAVLTAALVPLALDFRLAPVRLAPAANVWNRETSQVLLLAHLSSQETRA